MGKGTCQAVVILLISVAVNLMIITIFTEQATTATLASSYWMDNVMFGMRNNQLVNSIKTSCNGMIDCTMKMCDMMVNNNIQTVLISKTSIKSCDLLEGLNRNGNNAGTLVIGFGIVSFICLFAYLFISIVCIIRFNNRKKAEGSKLKELSNQKLINKKLKQESEDVRWIYINIIIFSYFVVKATMFLVVLGGLTGFNYLSPFNTLKTASNLVYLMVFIIEGCYTLGRWIEWSI